MKETKVYVDGLPKCCKKCVFCYDNRPYWKSTDCRFLKNELDEDEIETSRDKDCPLIDIKTHDRELVKEVCEKIRSRIDKAVEYYPVYESVMGCILPSEMYDILDQIQKDIENG